ncbi:MAG: 50S ribosomal protein L4 [Acidobacteria bacterium]|nr:50S ribosomal protein L4 [Acidobacteriota bacterium]
MASSGCTEGTVARRRRQQGERRVARRVRLRRRGEGAPAPRGHPCRAQCGPRFQPRTQFVVKVNRKARRSALRGALSSHAANGTFGVLDGASFDGPSTKTAADLLVSWGKDAPVVVVATDEEQDVIKSFRNLDRVVVAAPSELEVSAVVWARSMLVTQDALESVQGRAS